jgi:hypothetical protein
VHVPVTPNNRMQRAGHDKVHARDRYLRPKVSDYAPQGRRAVADAGRYATYSLAERSRIRP